MQPFRWWISGWWISSTIVAQKWTMCESKLHEVSNQKPHQISCFKHTLFLVMTADSVHTAFSEVACSTWTCFSPASDVAHCWTKSSTYACPPSFSKKPIDAIDTTSCKNSQCCMRTHFTVKLNMGSMRQLPQTPLSQMMLAVVDNSCWIQ